MCTSSCYFSTQKAYTHLLSQVIIIFFKQYSSLLGLGLKPLPLDFGNVKKRTKLQKQFLKRDTDNNEG